MNYLDTSALIKRFVAELGSAALERLIARAGTVATATVAYAEAYSGLTRRRREGALSISGYVRACRDFERDWAALLRVELRVEVLDTARAVTQRHGLRGFDAIHLASALTLEAGAREPVTVVAADERMLRAAAAEGLSTLNIETGRVTRRARR